MLKKKCFNIFEKMLEHFTVTLIRWVGEKIKNIHLDGRRWVESAHTKFHHGFQLLRARL
jgi:hypothetical protein